MISYFNEQILVHSLSASVSPKTNIIFSPFLNTRMKILFCPYTNTSLSLYEHWGQVKNNYLPAQWNVFVLKTYDYMLMKESIWIKTSNLCLKICFKTLLCCSHQNKAVYVCVLSCWVISGYFVTPWTVARQAPLFMGFPRQEYWSGLPFPSPQDLPDPGITPAAPILADRLFNTIPPRKPNIKLLLCKLFNP